MDSFKILKRRTTELFNSLPSSLPAIKSPTFGSGNSNTMRGTWEKLQLPPLPRSGHTADIVDGTVYIFGGGNDNDVHTITLPASGAQADYYTIKAKPVKSTAPKPKDPNPDVPSISIEETPNDEPQNLSDISLTSPPPGSKDKGKSPASPTSSLPDIPPPRRGHASAVIGHRIFLFGGSSPSTPSQPLNESGRVWIFDTRNHLWSFLDPALATPAHPSPRFNHAAVSTPKPDNFSPSSHPSGHTTWKEWALGTDTTTLHEQGIPQDPVVGFLAEKARDLDSEGYGTFIISGGTLPSGEASDETWAFDVHSSTWQPLPSSLSPVTGRCSLALAKNRLYKLGGGEGGGGGSDKLKMEYLSLSLDSFNDVASAGEEVLVTAKGGWKPILPGKEDVKYKTPDLTAVPLDDDDDDNSASFWPAARTNASLSVVTIGGVNGREYLLLAFGEDGQGGKMDDVWAFLTPKSRHEKGRHGVTEGSFVKAQDAVWDGVGGLLGGGRDRHQEGMWFRVEMGVEDEEDDDSLDGPGRRAQAAMASIGDLDESGVVIWGGVVGQGDRVKGDGWVMRLK
ncbi:hypothetical protein QC761_201680 [Podospora bellae-mahoneyi]|uniref:Uncharacterized protein n=1 Tax=Podospora bellae-mahoneyi TaxID=2093777 RepID=A0ABR0FQ65_9PEZI|nr:hypothetical protein QC761_201680 [Podospora bellae-mahoneyi]